MNKITFKIILLTFSMSLMVGIIMSITLFYALNSTNTENSALFEKHLHENFDIDAKHQVQTVYSLIEGVNSLPETDSFGIEEKKKLAADIVRGLKYGTDGYFWIDTENGDNVVLQGQPVEGTNRYDIQDSRGKYIVRELIKNGLQPGGGYTDYYFPKKGDKEPLPKRSYSLAYNPFNWVIGTGNYMDDIDHAIIDHEQNVAKAQKTELVIVILIIGVLLFLSYIFSTLFGRRLSSPIIDISGKMQELSTGNLDVDIQINQNDEIGELAQATQAMIEKLRSMVGGISKGADEILNAGLQMNDGSQQLSQGANEQAASTEEVSASMEQMVANIQQNALNAAETEKISIAASQGIKKVTDRSHESLDAIRSIAQKIDIINDIINHENIIYKLR